MTFFVFKGVLPPFEWSTSVIPSFPTFLVSISAPHNDLSSLKTTLRHTVISYDKFSVSTVMGAIWPILYGVSTWINIFIDIRARPTSNPVIDNHQTQPFTLLTGFHCFLMLTDPYWI